MYKKVKLKQEVLNILRNSPDYDSGEWIDIDINGSYQQYSKKFDIPFITIYKESDDSNYEIFSPETIKHNYVCKVHVEPYSLINLELDDHLFDL
jgi:ribosomal protein L21E